MLPEHGRGLSPDGILADRPLGVTRNSIYLPARYNVDFRYSRFFPFGGSRRAEVLLELLAKLRGPGQAHTRRAALDLMLKTRSGDAALAYHDVIDGANISRQPCRAQAS